MFRNEIADQNTKDLGIPRGSSILIIIGNPRFGGTYHAEV
jgi:hypothetical protein